MYGFLDIWAHPDTGNVVEAHRLVLMVYNILFKIMSFYNDRIFTLFRWNFSPLHWNFFEIHNDFCKYFESLTDYQVWFSHCVQQILFHRFYLERRIEAFLEVKIYISTMNKYLAVLKTITTCIKGQDALQKVLKR